MRTSLTHLYRLLERLTLSGKENLAQLVNQKYFPRLSESATFSSALFRVSPFQVL
jgi:hypothetical protein